MRLHVLTACTRPENLEKLARSIQRWPDTSWHIRFDPHRRSIGGQQLKNEMLDEIADGWVFILDDDTVAHPGLYKRIPKSLAIDAVVVSQEHSVFGVLRAAEENVAVGSIDIGQVVCRRSVIGSSRIPLSYAGDGEFWVEVLAKANVVYLDEVLSYHNAIEEEE